MKGFKRETKRLLRRFFRPWWRRPFTWVLIGLVPALVIGRLALTPYVEGKVRARLNSLPGGALDFEDADVYVFPPVLVLHGAKTRDSGGGIALEISRLEVHASSWRTLREDSPRVRVRAVNPRVVLADGASPLPPLSALPRARVEALVVEGGMVSIRAGATERPLWEGASAQVLGLVTGSAPPADVIVLEGEGRVFGTADGHVVVRQPRSGSWEGKLELRGLAAGPTADPAQRLDVNATGRGRDLDLDGTVSVGWSLVGPPHAAAEALVANLDELRPFLGAHTLARVASVAGDETTSSPAAGITTSFRVTGRAASADRMPFQVLVDVARAAAAAVPAPESFAQEADGDLGQGETSAGY